MTKIRREQIDLEKIARDVSEWFSSPEGQRAIKESARLASELSKRLDDAHRADPKALLDPCTV